MIDLISWNILLQNTNILTFGFAGSNPLCDIIHKVEHIFMHYTIVYQRKLLFT
jgi:hypothetical protein